MKRLNLNIIKAFVLTLIFFGGMGLGVTAYAAEGCLDGTRATVRGGCERDPNFTGPVSEDALNQSATPGQTVNANVNYTTDGPSLGGTKQNNYSLGVDTDLGNPVPPTAPTINDPLPTADDLKVPELGTSGGSLIGQYQEAAVAAE